MSHKLDEVDLKIIYSLARDARKTITQIAKDTEISRPTIISRLRKLRESNVLSLDARVNVTKLGFKLALLALKIRSVEAEQKPETNLAVCPRVLMLMHSDGNSNCFALLYGENMETLVSVVESFRSFSGIEVISWHPSEPPLKVEAFELKEFPSKNKLAPCGKNCLDCSSYKKQECLACPVVTAYKGTTKMMVNLL